MTFPTCTCPSDSKVQLLAKINNNLSYLLSEMSGGEFQGSLVNVYGCMCSEAQILASINNQLVSAFSTIVAAGLTTGKVALVAGTQSYAIVFGAGFAAAPDFFTASIQMVDSNGEVFEVVPDLSTLTATGVTVWLSGIPTAASTGAYINWAAKE